MLKGIFEAFNVETLIAVVYAVSFRNDFLIDYSRIPALVSS